MSKKPRSQLKPNDEVDSPEKKMRLSEFANAKVEYRNRTGLALLLALLLIGLYCVLLAAYLGEATAYILHHFSPPIAGFVQGFLMFPIIFILLFTIWLFDRKANGDSRLRCPHCGKRIDDKSDIVIATKNCPYCGKIVLVQDT